MNEGKKSSSDIRAEVIILAFQLYYTPILVSLGTIGNCLSVYILFKTKMRRVSSSWYLSALAISDTGFLISLILPWLNIVGVNIYNRPGYCQFFTYLSTLCSFLSVWFVVTFTVERFIAVRYPLKRQSMCTVARAKTILIILSIIGSIICSPILWLSSSKTIITNITVQNVTNICDVTDGWQHEAKIFNITDTILTFAIPFTVIVILNGLITKTVWKLANVRKTLTINSTRNKKSQNCPKLSTKSQTKITKMLLIVSTFFLCFNLPAYVMRVEAFLEEGESPRSIVITQHICNLLFNTNFGINFVLYCASGQNFRKAVISMIIKRPRQWINGTNNSGFRRSSSMARQRTIVVEVPWSENCQLREFSRGDSRRKRYSRQNSSEKESDIF